MSDGAGDVPPPLTVPRTPAEKRRAVEALLADPDWAKCSNGAVARRCGVSDALVGDVRRGYRRRSTSRQGAAPAQPVAVYAERKAAAVAGAAPGVLRRRPRKHAVELVMNSLRVLGQVVDVLDSVDVVRLTADVRAPAWREEVVATTRRLRAFATRWLEQEKTP